MIQLPTGPHHFVHAAGCCAGCRFDCLFQCGLLVLVRASTLRRVPDFASVSFCRHVPGGWNNIPMPIMPSCHMIAPCPSPWHWPPHRPLQTFSWLHATRVGEASNPGPEPGASFRVAVTNPTAVHNKVPELLSLNSDLIFAAETSAVAKVQHKVATDLRQHGYKAFWSHPVPPLLADTSADTSLRGMASGVAVFTRVPARPSLCGLTPELIATSRLLECFCRIGVLEVRVLCVYGTPSCHPQSSDLNNFLLQSSLDRVRLSQIPTIVAGDWNCEVCNLPAWQGFQALGYAEAFSVAYSRQGTTLAPTCKNSTRNDTALLSPVLVELFQDAHVLVDSHLFDSHSPLLLDFRVPSALPTTRRWALPKPWDDFQFEQQAFAAAYDGQVENISALVAEVSTRNDLDQAFQSWARAVENSVDCAIRQHSPSSSPPGCGGLPRSHRGRCKPLRIVTRPCPQLPRPGRAGEFCLQDESTSIKVKWKLKQCRRLRAFKGGLRKHLALSQPDEQLLQQLLDEWAAIRRAKGYGRSFEQWVLSWHFVSWFPIDFPTMDWTDSILQLVEYDCQAHAGQDAYRKRQFARFSVREDVNLGHSKQGFQQLRGHPRPAFSAVTTRISQPVDSARCLGDGEFLLQVPWPTQFRPGLRISMGPAEGLIVAAEAQGVHVAFGSDALPAVGHLEQEIHDCAPHELHAGFFAFWQPLWNRDSPFEAESLAPWAEFRALLAALPSPWPEIPVNMEDLQQWRHVLNKTPNRKATGACGFAVRELKQLPDAALLHLIRLCSHAVRLGFPDVFLQGRINVLAKVADPQSYNDGRPICVLPVIYRLWSSVMCQQLLKAWAPLMPAGIQGGLPGRSARDITYHLQILLEQSHQDGSALSGFVLDIIKCFNALPRQPIKALLQHLGCPAPLSQCWVDGLNRLQRCSSFGGTVSSFHPSSTGAPEGDGLSMVAAIAVCWMLHATLQQYSIDAALFVDNWAWTSELVEVNEIAMRETTNLTRALKLSVDWNKSFAWARDSSSYSWWDAYGPELLPDGARFQLLPTSKDLGAAMRYRGPSVLGCLHNRIQEGHLRLRCLKHMPRTIANKAHLMQMSIWPAVFYGAEGHAIGLRRIHELRASAAKALVGGHHHSNPHLALGLLSTRLQDPEMFYLTGMLRCLRRTLQRAPHLGQLVLQTAARASGSPYHVHGPGTALSAVLRRNGWTISDSAQLVGPGNHRLCLFTCSSQDIKRVLSLAWAHHLRQVVCHRNGLHTVDIPDAATTVKVLHTFPHAQQKILSRHLTGSFQTAATKVLWGASATAACPWCGMDETRQHRFLQCPAFQHIRDKHRLATQALEEKFPHWVYSPFAVLPAAVDITTLLFESRPHPAMPRDEGARIRTEGLTSLRFFTDGTCRHPQFPLARHAAWSAVLDTSASAHDQEIGLQYWMTTAQPPPAFQTRSCGLVHGRQTISRAELTAAVQAVRMASLAGKVPVTVVTDSSYVCRILRQFSAGLDLAVMSASANLDLLHLLKEVWFSEVRVEKVKSHQDPLQWTDRRQQWTQLGNVAADKSCAQALSADMSIVTEMVDSIAEEQSEQVTLLRAVFVYLLELNAATQQLLDKQKDSAALSSSDPGDRGGTDAAQSFPDQALAEWVQCRRQWSRTPPLPLPRDDVFHYNSWGPAFTWRVWSWAQTLSWTQPMCPPSEAVTTLELFCDFTATTAALPPMVISNHQGGQRHVPFNEPAAQLGPQTLRSWLHALTTCMRQLERATNTKLFGGPASRKVTGLASLGDTQARSGYLSHCQFADPSRTSLLVRAVLLRRTTGTFQTYVHDHRHRLLSVPPGLAHTQSLSHGQRLARRNRR